MTQHEGTSLQRGAIVAIVALALLTALSWPARRGEARVALAPELTPTATFTPTAVATVNVANAIPITCNARVVNTTAGAAASVASYSCASWWPETGPERVFVLTVNTTVRLDALLSGLQSDLDVFLLADARATSCLAYGDTSLTTPALAPGVYYLVVDGFSGAAGAFQLDVWCPLQTTPTSTPTVTPTATPRPAVRTYYLPLMLHNAAGG